MKNRNLMSFRSRFGIYMAVLACTTLVLASCSNFYNDLKNSNVPALVSPASAPANYTVNVLSGISGGNVDSDKTAAAEGEIVTLTVTPANGYELSEISVTAADGTSVAMSGSGSARTFTMPAQNVTIVAVFAAITYTVTFNANDGSQNPATASQTFTAGTPQNLRTVTELGFTKEGFYFAGWLVSADAAESSYADGSGYTAKANATLYAKWSAVPVYSVNTPANERGVVTPTPATAVAGTEITLAVTAKDGYKFSSYTVIDVDGGSVALTDGKFIMPEKDVTVIATFDAISYTVICGSFSNGNVVTSLTTATVGTDVTLTITPASGYKLDTVVVADAGGNSVLVSGTDNTRIFTMPASNVTVSATFSAINYNINVGTFVNGSVVARPTTATARTSVTITASPSSGYTLDKLNVIAEDGVSLTLSGTGNTRTFRMPAKNVTVTATFTAINYNIDVGTFAHGSVSASPATATVGTNVTLTISPASGYELSTLVVIESDSDRSAVSLSGSGDTWTFTMPAKNVTVIAAFYVYMTLGSWPQTIKSTDVGIDESDTKTVGDFTYCKGSDGQWYAKIKENGYNSIYSDGTAVGLGGTNEKWFKVEPIKWRVLTTDYNGTGKTLLHAENILIGKRYDESSNNYQNSEIRKWLNSNANSAAVSDHGDSGGFLKTAFTAAELAKIADTIVDNSARSTNPDVNATKFHGGENLFASVTPTTDKVFLLSEREVSASAYGFEESEGGVRGSTRIRQTTDYARASGVVQYSMPLKCLIGGVWWLRSPSYGDYCDDDYNAERDYYVYFVNVPGDSYRGGEVYRREFGVVPALCVGN